MKAKLQKPNDFRRSPCPVANTLDLIGDKWSLLVIRDMRHGKSTYGELLNSPEGIPTNLLADRLKRLEAAGIIVRSAYQDRPVRYTYSLSEKGKELGHVLLALVEWGKKHIPGTHTIEELAPSAARTGSGRSSTRTPRKRNAS